MANYSLHSLCILVLLIGQTTADDQTDLFVRLDANRDGQITITEIPQTQIALFERLIRKADTDRDERLSAQEFQAGLASTRPEKPLTEKAESELPGSDALLLVLAWMDENADLTITAAEVPPTMRPLFDDFVELLNSKDAQRLPVPQLRQQTIRYLALARRFTMREGIDVEVELALLNDKQWAYVQRLQTSLKPGSMMQNPDNALMLFTRLDTDGDGNITAGEVPEPYAERFTDLLERADRDQDKQLSEQEFKAMSQRVAKFSESRPSLAETNQGVKQLLRRADRNDDGQISREEAPPRMAQRFPRLDQNGDGQLDQTELSRAVEILATLRNSAGIQPASAPLSGERTKKPRKN
ncbi:MAG: hypothetical protein SH868_03430 [Bythopirellula sp.]|nr:hypothetical protein [Bythopirellula sp.]